MPSKLASKKREDWASYLQAFSDVIDALQRVEEYLRHNHFTVLDLFRGESMQTTFVERIQRNLVSSICYRRTQYAT
jgi:crotonobetainyl-CoA:carnitine CoA-transferase CaiB-like acyl-CoA transferase